VEKINRIVIITSFPLFAAGMLLARGTLKSPFVRYAVSEGLMCIMLDHTISAYCAVSGTLVASMTMFGDIQAMAWSLRAALVCHDPDIPSHKPYNPYVYHLVGGSVCLDASSIQSQQSLYSDIETSVFAADCSWVMTRSTVYNAHTGAVIKFIEWPCGAIQWWSAVSIASTEDSSSLIGVASTDNRVHIWAIHKPGAFPIKSVHAVGPDGMTMIYNALLVCTLGAPLPSTCTIVCCPPACSTVACTEPHGLERRVLVYRMLGLGPPEGPWTPVLAVRGGEVRTPVILSDTLVVPTGTRTEAWDLDTGTLVASWRQDTHYLVGYGGIVACLRGHRDKYVWETRVLPPSRACIMMLVLAAQRRSPRSPTLAVEVWRRLRAGWGCIV